MFHIFLGDKTNEIVREIDDWISTEPMRRWTTFVLQKPVIIEFCS